MFLLLLFVSVSTVHDSSHWCWQLSVLCLHLLKSFAALFSWNISSISIFVHLFSTLSLSVCLLYMYFSTLLILTARDHCGLTMNVFFFSAKFQKYSIFDSSFCVANHYQMTHRGIVQRQGIHYNFFNAIFSKITVVLYFSGFPWIYAFLCLCLSISYLSSFHFQMWDNLL